jgi:hypothetical protein
MAKAVSVGVLASLAYFVPFRVMMRFFSDDHVFGWAGTAAIAIYCVLVGAVTGVLYAGRQRGWGVRARLAPSIVCVVLLSAFFFFAAPSPAVAGLLTLAAGMPHWRPWKRWALVGLAVAIMAALFVVIVVYTPSAWGLPGDIAGFAMLIPQTVVLAIPLDLALTRARTSEVRRRAASGSFVQTTAAQPA